MIETRKKIDLVALKAMGLPRATRESVGISITAKADADDEAKALCIQFNAAIDEYLNAFAMPQNTDAPVSEFIGNGACLACGATLGGILGSFQWGICHGEGRCSRCGYPARALHRIKDKDGKEIFDRALTSILQYHPDELEDKPQP